MLRSLSLLFLSVILAASTAPAQQPAQPGAAEAKLREGLRNTMLQLRTMQGERDQLIIDKTMLEGEKKDLTDKLEALTKQAAANQAAAQQSVTALEAKITVRETEAVQLNASLAKWQAAQKEAAALAAKKESERATAASRVVELDRQVADQQRKNAAMFKIGNEVLYRYEKFVLGDALVAREPFTGIARVKFQTLVQDFQDQLTDQRIKPSEARKPDAEITSQTSSTPASAPTKKAAAKPAPVSAPSTTPAPKAAKFAGPKATS